MTDIESSPCIACASDDGQPTCTSGTCGERRADLARDKEQADAERDEWYRKAQWLAWHGSSHLSVGVMHWEYSPVEAEIRLAAAHKAVTEGVEG